MRKAWIVAAALAAPQLAPAAPLPAPTSQPCREQATGRALDFWIGDWNVVNLDGSKAGENRIERILDGCAVVEHWHGVDAGDDGISLFSYDAANHTWEQVWVTQDTSRPNGLKHQKLSGILYANALRFEGRIALRNGKTILWNRIPCSVDSSSWVQVDLSVKAGLVSSRVKTQGQGWTDLGSVASFGRDFTQDKVGFYIPPNDEVAVANFKFANR